MLKISKVLSLELDIANALVDSKLVLSRNKENLTIEELEFDGVEYETTVLLSDLRDNPAYTKYYTFLTR